MQVDRHIELGGPLEDGPEFLCVEKAPIRQPTDQGTLETELGDRALQLVGGRLRIWRRESGEPGKPVRMDLDSFVKNVVRLPRQGDRHVRREDLRTGLQV